MTILSTKAGVLSRSAGSVEFIRDQGNSDSMGRQPYGSVTITQVAQGIDYPNVQSAVEDIRAFTIRPVNSIEINTDGVSPEGISQVDEWTFSGTVTSPTAAIGSTVILNIFGFPVTALVGDTAEEFVTKARAAIDVAVAANTAIESVNIKPLTSTTLTIVYIDNQPHALNGISSFGITVIPTTVSPAKPGYGAWVRIGSKNETLDGASGPVTLHYFKRLA